jgi:hypothetical protein
VLRGIFALAAGLFAAMILITGSGLLSAKWLFPPPPGLDLRDAAQVAAFVASLPLAALLWILAGWLLGALVGGLVSARLAGQYELAPPVLVGLFIAAGTWLNALSIPHPAWMVALGVLLPIPAALLGARLVRKASPAPGK